MNALLGVALSFTTENWTSKPPYCISETMQDRKLSSYYTLTR